ncbi:AAA domain-containing protein [Saccharopolyspora shandongensis]|uniref:AAA domain-containing protein n=1 Tax=Saccharopolyspora shandongensis TaxID=418495 RepID=A0A1H3S8J7_9PSEU|nr:AAA family ATPase [Saccharopolyspora shandongensis]SDZ34282.1 AAA domain-containing protein [Saccharopolyspora shandongensis]
MRLESFGVTGYGIFGDLDLDLSAPGLHVLLGPNGVGKSTLAQAMADLLYGVPERTPYAFRTAPSKLRLRATVTDADGKRTDIVRRKGRKKTLLRPDGTPIADDEFLPFLAGVSRENYESSFVLTQHQLREAGHALARGEGRLGELLFHAQGVQAPVTVLQEIEERKDAIFRPRGQVLDLNKAIRDYRDCRTKVHEFTTPPRVYTELTNDFARTSAEVDALSQQLDDATEQQRRWETVQSRRSDVQRRRTVLRQLEILSRQGVFVPLGAAAELDKIRVQRANARNEVDRINTELSQLNGRLDELVIDHTMLNHAAEITALSADRTSQSEKRQRLDELVEPVAEAQRLADTTRSAVSSAWSHDDALADVIPAGASETIAALCKQYVEHTTEQAEVTQQIQRYQNELTHATEKLHALPDVLDPMDLEVAIERVREADAPERRLSDARRAASRAENKARQELQDLGINERELEHLGTVVLPTRARINTLCRQADELDDRDRDLHKDIMQSHARRRKAQRDLDGLLLGDPPPTEEELDAARTRRDNDLEQLRSDCAVSPPHDAKRLTERLAGIHEAVTVTDGMADRMRREASALARRHQLVATIETENADIDELASDANTHAADRTEWEKSWRTLWAATGTSPTPAEAIDVHSRLTKARDHARSAEEHNQRVDQLTDEIDSLTTVQRRELDAIEQPAPQQQTLNELLHRAERHLKSIRNHAHERDSALAEVNRASDELTSLEQRERTCTDRIQAWQHRWDQAVDEARPTAPGRIRTTPRPC